MKRKINLINEIEYYISTSRTSYNNNRKFDCQSYIYLNNNIESLNCNDFSDYKSFILFIDWKNYEFRKFKNDNMLLILESKNINKVDFLFLLSYLRGIVNWMN